MVCSAFGFKIAYESTRSLTTYVRLGESLLEIIEAGDADRVSRGDRYSGFRHMAISVIDINKAYKNMSSRGVAFKSEPREKEDVWTSHRGRRSPPAPQLIFRAGRCMHCFSCMKVCPNHAIVLVDGNPMVLDDELAESMLALL